MKFSTHTTQGFAVITVLIAFAANSITEHRAHAGLTQSENEGSKDKTDHIIQQLKEKIRGFGDMTAHVEMLLTDTSGRNAKRSMEIRILESAKGDSGDRSIVTFSSPNDIKGTVLLSHIDFPKPDRQWLFLPSLSRTQRISGRISSGPFMGSEFSYEDITGGDIRKFSWKLLGEERCGRKSVQCYKLDTHPLYNHSGYSRRVVWVDKEHYRIQKIDFYDRKGTKIKTLEYSDYRLYLDKYWRAHSWTMKNVQSGKLTTLTFKNIRFRSGLGKSDFDRAALERM